MFVFPLPEIGEGVVEGEIVRWLVKPGDDIATDQPLCEVMTDKATVEISSPKSGRVAKLHGNPGDVVKVHAPLVEIDLGGGASASAAPAAHAPAAHAPAAHAPAPKPAPAAAPAPVAAPKAAPVAAAPAPKPAPVAAAPKHASTGGGLAVLNGQNGVPAPIVARMPPPPGGGGRGAP
ncbi:MAG: biotin/lipoyl-containing protein, partial [Myxococcota bacterium]